MDRIATMPMGPEVAPMAFFRLASMDGAKADELALHILNDPYHVSDENRNPIDAYRTIYNYFSGDERCGSHMVLEGGGGGYLIFGDIVPGFKCKVGPKCVREAQDVLITVAKAYSLIRMETKTPDQRVVKMSRKFFGFEVEGVQRDSFMQDGVLSDSYILGRDWRNK